MFGTGITAPVLVSFSNGAPFPSIVYERKSVTFFKPQESQQSRMEGTEASQPRLHLWGRRVRCEFRTDGKWSQVRYTENGTQSCSSLVHFKGGT
jgi:hypothetical protein